MSEHVWSVRAPDGSIDTDVEMDLVIHGRMVAWLRGLAVQMDQPSPRQLILTRFWDTIIPMIGKMTGNPVRETDYEFYQYVFSYWLYVLWDMRLISMDIRMRMDKAYPWFCLPVEEAVQTSVYGSPGTDGTQFSLGAVIERIPRAWYPDTYGSVTLLDLKRSKL